VNTLTHYTDDGTPMFTSNAVAEVLGVPHDDIR
jgi:phage regulator Rha-like protein